MTDHANLESTVALVTGGGSGIGAALCQRLAAAGARVVVADIDNQGAEAVTAGIGSRAHALSLDVSSQDAWSEALGHVVERFGKLDMLALNAGTMSRPRGVAADDDPFPWMQQRYELVRGVNLDGVFYGIMAALPHLQKSKGHIACTASVAGLKPLAIDPAYAMSKHGVVGLVRSMAEPLASRDITIGAVCPGGVDTPLVGPDIRALGRSFASPDHVAEAIEHVLRSPIEDSGTIWISRETTPAWRHQFANSDVPPAD